MPPDLVFELPPAGILLTVLAAVTFVALLVQAAMHLPRVVKASSGLSEVSPAIVAVCGAIFGLSVTFLANSVWSTEDRARETVYAEARAMKVMQIYMASITGPSRDGLSRLISDYARAVAAEWPRMGEDGPGPAAEQALKDIYAAVINGFALGDQNRLVQQRFLIALDSLSIARQQRLSMAQEVVSFGQWVLVMGLALLLLVMAAVLHARAPMARWAALAAVTAVITFTLFVILRHDRPFTGYYALTPQPILRAADVMP